MDAGVGQSGEGGSSSGATLVLGARGGGGGVGGVGEAVARGRADRGGEAWNEVAARARW